VLLSDGTASIGYTPETDAPAAIARRNAALAAEPVVVFTYSMGAAPTSDGGVGKSIACQTGGIWAAVPSSSDEQLKLSLAGFYSYYAAAVADVERHVVWSEPYTYVGTGFLGTTVTSPAFDRTDPSNPVFIGVAGIDLLIPAMETIHGGDADDARAGVMRALGERAATNCPDQLPTSSPDFECEIQSLRRASGAGSPGR
jgi:hypothetical protein